MLTSSLPDPNEDDANVDVPTANWSGEPGVHLSARRAHYKCLLTILHATAPLDHPILAILPVFLFKKNLNFDSSKKVSFRRFILLDELKYT